MACPSQIREFLKSRLQIFIVAAFCFPPDSTKGNSIVVLNEPSGEFQSPGYPDLDEDIHCTWNISAPPYHRITITFLDFDLEERLFCIDEVEIYDGDVKRGTYRGTQLYNQSITSTSNTVSVVLITCLTSLFADRRGIRVSYSTFHIVSSTTSPKQTNKMVTSTQPPLVTTIAIKSTLKRTISIQINPTLLDALAFTTILSSTEYTEVPASANNTGQGLLYTLIGALLFALIVTIIAVMFIFKRKKAKSSSRNTTNRSGNVETNQAKGYFTTVVPERNSVKSLDHDYSEVNEKQTDMNSVYYSRSIVSTSLNSSMLQNKHSQLDASNNLCVYENDTSHKQNKTAYDQDYSNTIYRIQQPSPSATK